MTRAVAAPAPPKERRAPTAAGITARLWGAGALAYAIGDLAHHQGDGLAGAVAGGVAGAAVLAGKYTRRRRIARLEPLMHAVAGVLGAPVTLERARFRHGQVLEVVGSYPHATNDLEPAMRDRMAATAGAKLGAPVEVDWRPERSMLRIRRRPVAVDQAGRVTQRVEEVVALLLGHDARVEHLERNEAGEPVAFEVRYPVTARAGVPDFRARADAVLAELTGARWSSWWDTAHDLVTYKRRAVLPEKVTHPADALPGSPHALPFALAAGDQVIAWDLDGLAPHALVIGKTGSGKTVAMRAMILEACKRGIAVYISDPKRVSLGGLRYWPGVQTVATRLEDMTELVEHLHDEMERRYQRIERGQVDSADLAPLLLVMDEQTEWIGRVQAAWKDAKGRGEAPAIGKFASIARLGREARVHLLVGLQRPDAAILGGEARDNFGCRLVMGAASRIARDMVEVDETTTAAVKGRGVADVGDGSQEVQVFWVPDPGRWDRLRPEDRAILDGLRPPAGPGQDVLLDQLTANELAAGADDLEAHRDQADNLAAELAAYPLPLDPPPAEPPPVPSSPAPLRLLRGDLEPAEAPEAPSGPAADSGPEKRTHGPEKGAEQRCSLCGKGGHNKRSCPDAATMRKCSRCGKPGHTKASCKARACSRCGKVGHTRNRCPQGDL